MDPKPLCPELLGIMRRSSLDELSLVERAAGTWQRSRSARRWIDLSREDRSWFCGLVADGVLRADPASLEELNSLADAWLQLGGGGFL